MGLGILEDRKIEHAPGTALLNDITTIKEHYDLNMSSISVHVAQERPVSLR